MIPKHPCKLCGKLTSSRYEVCSSKKTGCREEWDRLSNSEKSVKQWRIENPIKCMLTAAKARAKLAGIPFNLSEKDVVIPEKCPILDIPILRGNDKAQRNSPSLDRIVPELGYIKGNVQVISQRANIIKNDATPEELLKFADWIYENFKETK